MDIFDWKQPSSWPKFLGSFEITEGEVDDELIWEFYNSYTHIRAYHSARPHSPKSYLEEGIRLADYRALEHEFRTNMKGIFGIEISTEHLEYAKEKIGEFHNKSLFLVLDDRDLLEHAGHYAIYGSEYVHALANHIHHQFGVGGAHYLKKIGTPTVFEVLLDIELVTESDLRQITCKVNNYLYYREVGEPIDFTIELYRSVAGASIAGYYHPKRIKNPNQGFKYEYR